MKIAIIHELWAAGAARCARDLERELGERHDVRFYPQAATDTQASLEQALADFDPDVVNCHSFYSHLDYGFLADVSHKFPTCFTVHDPRPIGTIDWRCWDCDRNNWCIRCPLLPKWRKLIRNPYFTERLYKRRQHNRCADDLQVVTPSDWLRQRLSAQELARFEIHHIPNGVDLSAFEFVDDARQTLGWPLDKPIVLHTAATGRTDRFDDRKGLVYLSDAFRETVLPAMSDAHLAVVGEAVAPNFRNTITMGRIPVEQMPLAYTACDLFVTPTLADNLPYTVLEAMAASRPVIGSAVGGVPEEIEHGRTGLVFPAGDSKILGQQILDILGDPARAAEMGRAGRKRAEQSYGMAEFIAAYERLFESMVESRAQESGACA